MHDPGLDTSNLISFTVNPALAGYDQARQAFYHTLLETHHRRLSLPA